MRMSESDGCTASQPRRCQGPVEGFEGFLRLEEGFEGFLRLVEGFEGFLRLVEGFEGFLRLPDVTEASQVFSGCAAQFAAAWDVSGFAKQNIRHTQTVTKTSGLEPAASNTVPSECHMFGSRLTTPKHSAQVPPRMRALPLVVEPALPQSWRPRARG